MTGEIKSVADSLSDVYDEVYSSDTVNVETQKAEQPQTDVDQTTEIEEKQGAQEEITEQDETPAQDDDVIADVEAPISWNKRDREAFKNASPEIKQIVARREEEVNRYLHHKTQELALKERSHREIDDVLEPYKADLNMRGISSGQLVRSLIGLQENLDRNPVQAISMLMQNYGLTPESLSQQSEPVDPRYQALQTKINGLESSLSQFEQQKLQEQFSYNESDVAYFAESKDNSGKPAYPHFQNVYNEMLPLVAQLRTQYPTADNYSILQHAYEKACWLNPEVRMQLVREQARLETSKQLQSKAQNAQKAKSASISISGNPDGGNGQINKQSKGRVIDDLSDVYDELNG